MDQRDLKTHLSVMVVTIGAAATLLMSCHKELPELDSHCGSVKPIEQTYWKQLDARNGSETQTCVQEYSITLLYTNQPFERQYIRIAGLLAAQGYQEIPLSKAAGQVSITQSKPIQNDLGLKDIPVRVFAKDGDEVSLQATQFTQNRGSPFQIILGLFRTKPPKPGDEHPQIPKTPEEAGIKKGCFMFGLPGLRQAKGTYELVETESLPPLDGVKLDGTMGWLKPLTPQMTQRMKPYWPDAKHLEKVVQNYDRILREAKTTGLVLPEAFLRLMKSPELQKRFPSSTACYFDLPDRIVSSPLKPEGKLIRFLNDQQGVVFWYLLLKPDGTNVVATSTSLLDDPDKQMPEMFMCADSFETFLYRYWLENTIWFALEDKLPLSPVQARYAQFFGTHPKN